MSAVSYHVSQILATLFPNKAVIEGNSGSFQVEAYVGAKHCQARLKPAVHSQLTTFWRGQGRGCGRSARNAWLEIFWQGHSLDVLLMEWSEGGCRSDCHWIVADTQEVAENFFVSVCEWYAELRNEVWVFDGGYWGKSRALFHAIRNATFDSLILRGSLKQGIQDDFAQFFASREVYEKYRIPWTRGVLFIGPPGNGKTHTVKALINWLEQPCLYVKSLKSRYETDHGNIRGVFEHARQTTPCILVLEDLDAMVNDKNRSFFLNELDGFAANTGIVVLATTNHPERLDPALLNRPSRFDRKYYFELPAHAERQAYITAWNETLQPELQLPEVAVPKVAERTEGFSFAYLKELFLSSMMRWINAPRRSRMDVVMLAQVDVLREQISSMTEEPVVENVEGDDDGDEE